MPLQIGERVPLPVTDSVLKFELTFQLSKAVIDVSAFLLTEAQPRIYKVRGDYDMLFYNQLSAPNHCVRLENLENNQVVLYVSTQDIEPEISRIAICATIDGAPNLSVLQYLSFTVKEENNAIVVAQEGQRRREEAALILAELYRHNNGWRLWWKMQGFNGGLQPLAEHFGVEVDEQTEDVAPAPAVNLVPESHQTDNQSSKPQENQAENETPEPESVQHSEPEKNKTENGTSSPAADKTENKPENPTSEPQENKTENETPEPEPVQHSEAEKNKTENGTSAPAADKTENKPENPTSEPQENKTENETPEPEPVQQSEPEKNKTENGTSAPSADKTERQPKNPREKIILDKGNPSVLLTRRNTHTIRINFNWQRRVTSTNQNFFHKLWDHFANGSRGDLDLGAMVRMKNGNIHVIQALGDAKGSLTQEPFIELQGNNQTGELLMINSHHFNDIKQVVIYCFIYDGFSNWEEIDASAQVNVTKQPSVEIKLNDGNDKLGLCAIMELCNESSQNQIKVQRVMKYFVDQKKLDKHFNFGFTWTKGTK